MRTSLPAAPLDRVGCSVRSQILTGIARAHLGYIPVNREWENVCPDCGGDGCATCKHTGEIQ
jgi:hypothetical protein